MEQLKPTSSRKPVQILWIILSCIPFLNWIGFLVLGNATNQKKWTILGYVHFVLSLASASLFASWFVSYSYLANPHNDFDNLFPYLLFVSWLVGVVQAWWISGEAGKRLKQQFTALSDNSAATLTDITQKERIRSNLVYLLFTLIPISGLGLVTVGKTIKRKKLQVLGWVSYVLCALLEIAFAVLSEKYGQLGSYSYSFPFDFHPLFPFFIVLTQMPVLFLWVNALSHCVHSKSEYTFAYVQGFREYEQLKLLYPCLKSTAWKIKHSIHFLWCLHFFASPIALIHTGISDRKWKRLVCGIGSFIYYVVFFVISTMKIFEKVAFWLFEPLLILMGVLWIAIIWFSIATLREHLVYAAQKCGGYVDSFDAEQAKLEQTEQISAPKAQGIDE